MTEIFPSLIKEITLQAQEIQQTQYRINSKKVPPKYIIIKQLKTKVKTKSWVEWVVREGVGSGGRNKPSLVCTYE
jgi:hypothetical protein